MLTHRMNFGRGGDDHFRHAARRRAIWRLDALLHAVNLQHGYLPSAASRRIAARRLKLLDSLFV
jgi:hypothetical protein